MKSILMPFFLCFSVLFYAQKTDFQYSYKATYNLEYQEDSTDENSILSESFVLYLSDGHSRYSSLGTAMEDSIGGSEGSEFHYMIYKNYKENQLILTEKITADKYKFKYKQDLKTIDWEIQPENKEILGFTVQKATGSFAGRNYEAWFAPELPFLDGPYKFNGLPGLILEISDLEDDYHFSLTEFQEFEKPVTKTSNLDNYKLFSQEELDQFRDDNNRDPIAAMRNAGLKIAISKKEHEIETRKMLSEKYERRNNPIELQE